MVMSSKIGYEKLLFFFILTIYCIFIAPYGFEFWDTGYIPSFSWKIIQGETVYKDFFYKGPPVSLYFHALFLKILPIKGQFYFIRIVNYCLFACTTFFIVTGFNKLYSLKQLGINKWNVISVSFIISLLNFSPYPWPTTDGLFFISIAFYLMSNKYNSNLNLFLTALCLILGALCKQSFYLVPLLFLIWAFIKFKIKKVLIFLFFLSLLLSIFIFCLFCNGLLLQFIQQTTGETTLHQLYYTGLHNYIFISLKYFFFIFLIIGISFFGYLKYTKQELESLFNPLKYSSILFLILGLGFAFCKEILIASRFFFNGLLLYSLNLLIFKKYDLKSIFPIFVLLGIAWSTSISLGYPYPILFSTGLIVSLIYTFQFEIKEIKDYKFFTLGIIALCCIAVSYNYTPYREENRSQLNVSLSSISPKLNYLKTNTFNFKKLQDCKKLILKYGKNYIVAPNLPMVHYIFNDKSVMPADWVLNTEVNKNPKIFITIASKKQNFVFLEKTFLSGEKLMEVKGDDFSKIANYIYKNFNKIDETNYFIIYNGIKTSEKIPTIN